MRREVCVLLRLLTELFFLTAVHAWGARAASAEKTAGELNAA
jgi:hypothetical protein